MLIEIDTSVKPIEEFEVKLPSGVVYTQYAHYEHLPKFCDHCYIFGHLRESCRFLAPAKVSDEGKKGESEKRMEKSLEGREDTETHQVEGEGNNSETREQSQENLLVPINQDNSNSESRDHTERDL